MAVAIRFENVGKQYRLGEVGTGTISRDLERAWARLRGKQDPLAKIGTVNDPKTAGGEYVWALQDVSFDVHQGKVLGIIGRNGAGKSTLLKLLSRITAPSKGCIKAKGRIASLLEVGTGFHPELTGRENVALNGAILGMTRAEVNRRLDEIIEFSGCAKFIDTPVKRYSSGMTVRLGFSVAAHLECEILVVDEVLAVGDLEFQRKCVSRMSQVAGEGKTVLFVSHNMASIKNLSDEVVVLDHGGVRTKGTPDAGIQHYLALQEQAASRTELCDRARSKGVYPAINCCWIEDAKGRRVESVRMGDQFSVCLAFDFPDSLDVPLPLTIGFGLEDANTTRVFSLNNEIIGKADVCRKRRGVVRFYLKNVQLNQGRFFISPSITASGTQWLDAVEQATAFEVVVSDVFGSGKTLSPGQGLAYVNSDVRFSDTQI